MPAPDVIKVEPLGEMRLLLTFADGQRRTVDVAQFGPFVGVFQPLLDPEFFRRVFVNPDIGTICWPNGADICPDVLLRSSEAIAERRAG
ncbi:MAG: DUF2442 domain-containing protein [Phycisphaerales bacterium]